MLLIRVLLLINLIIILLLVLYPFVTWLYAYLFPKPVLKDQDFVQPVSIIIACHNEEKCIRQKINSFLDKDEWIEGSEIIVISNGSTDGTNEILEKYANDKRIRVIIDREAGSKIRSVNLGVELSGNDLLVFSDCRQLMKKGSVRQLISNFNDPDIGTVTATLMDTSDKKNVSLRTLLNFISSCESSSGSSLNVFGALYAQRKTVFRQFPADLLFDDLFVVVSTLLQKKRLISEKNAVIYDMNFYDYYGENRVQRLARGLLIFLFNHYYMVRQLSFVTYTRFMIFKYLKLVLPFSLLFLGLAIMFLIYFHGGFYTLLSVFLFFSLFIVGSIRRILLQLVTINYNFMLATMKFIWLKQRSNKWDKLDPEKAV